MHFKTTWFNSFKKSKVFLLVWLFLPAIFCMSILCNSCKQKTKNYEPNYATDSSHKKILLFGVPTQSYYEIYDLFVNYLNDHLDGAQVQTVVNSTLAGYMKKLGNQDFDLTIVNGGTALQSIRNGYAIIGRTVEEEGYAGAILVNKDSSINIVADLKGKTIASPGYPALGGHILQMLFLSKNGINVNTHIKHQYVESFESVFLNVYLGKCAAGFSTTNSWKRFIKRRPEIASRVTMKWATPAIVANALLLRNTVDKTIARQLKNLVFAMHFSERGKKALGKIGYLKFEPADSATYQPIKEFLKEYNALVVDHKQ